MSQSSIKLQEEVEKVNSDKIKRCKDINLKITDLTEKVLMLSWTLQQNLIDLYVNFTHTKSLEQINYKNRKSSIILEFEKVTNEVNQLKDNGNSRDSDFNQHWLKLEKSFQFLKDLFIATEGKRILWNAEHQFRRFKYTDAISQVQKLQKDLKTLKLDGDLATALNNLRSNADNQICLYMAHISVEFEELFNWSEKETLFHLTYSLSVQQNDAILMKNVLRALHLANKLNDELSAFSDYFINKLLHNLIRHNCEIFTDENNGDIILNIKINLNDKSKPNFQSVFNNLTAVFEFLQSTLDLHFDTEEKFIGVLAESVRSEFFHKIINDCIKTVLPTCKDSYENYQNLVTELDCFNKFLIDLNFVKAEESPLNEYMNTEYILYKKKYDKLLADIRLVMKESISYGTVCVGISNDIENESILNVTDKERWDVINKPLFLPKCIISQNVKHIMTMILKKLDDSVNFPDNFRNQLVVYIKDIAVMYQWLVPKQFKVNLESCPLDIALFFNNCFYLAHSLLGPSWQNILPIDLADNLVAVLMESIHDLRIVGLEKLSLYLQKQKDVITQKIFPKEQTPWTYESFRQFNSAVAETLAVMRDLKCSWWNVLPTKMYVMSMCTLIQALCQCMTDRLLIDTGFISEDLILQIRRTFDIVVMDIQLLFEEPIDIENKVNNWSKFINMKQLLKGQLLEISNCWNEDKELSKVYSCEEVRRIIKMRFLDDNVRLKILADIQ